MFLMFNKEFRQFESILSDLIKKMKKSQSITVANGADKGNTEIYKLDTIDIGFDVVKKIITVKDKSGAEIVSLDCHYDNSDEVQGMKFDRFSDVLSMARKIVEEREKEAKKKLKDFKEAAKRTDAAVREKQQREMKEQMLSNALNRLRDL